LDAFCFVGCGIPFSRSFRCRSDLARISSSLRCSTADHRRDAHSRPGFSGRRRPAHQGTRWGYSAATARQMREVALQSNRRGARICSRAAASRLWHLVAEGADFPCSVTPTLMLAVVSLQGETVMAVTDTRCVRMRAKKAVRWIGFERRTAWLGMSDSNSGIRARAMYLR
jgi:hypothetical protein